MKEQEKGRDQQLRQTFETTGLYRKESICLKPGSGNDYSDILLARKLELISRHYPGGTMVDLCCATGSHLLSLAPKIDEGIGIDFSAPYVEQANQDCELVRAKNIRFVVGNARELPFADRSIACLYCLSSLYVIPEVEEVIAEISRVLRSGGTCILDLGNSISLNAWIHERFYPELPKSEAISVPRMKRALADAGFELVDHRAFQILPLWADRPDWLSFLLSERWKIMLKPVVAGRMLDEWISSLPGVRLIAFRHMMVARKQG